MEENADKIMVSVQRIPNISQGSNLCSERKWSLTGPVAQWIDNASDYGSERE